MKEVPKILFVIQRIKDGTCVAVCNRMRDAKQWKRDDCEILEYRLRKKRVRK